MSVSAIPADVMHRLPAWQGADAKELHGGISNTTWLLQKDGRKAVLKFDCEVRGIPYNSRREEARVQSEAAEAGLANPVLYADDRVLLSVYAEGDVWTPASLNDKGNLERLADALRRLHAMPPVGRSFDAAAAAATYARDNNHDPGLVTICTDILAAGEDPERVCRCHNDLVAENFIDAPNLRFLDWEYACDNDPLFDLATVVEHHGLSEVRTAHLLDAYFEGDGERWCSGLRHQQRIYQALLWMWLASRRAPQDADLARAAERLLTSCS